MSKHKKLLQRLFRKPKDFKWSEMVTLLGQLGYTKLEGSGSRVKFFHKEWNNLIDLHNPHPENTVDIGAVKDVVGHLEDMGVKP